MLSKIVQRTTFSPWSESPTLPFVRFICQAKSHNFHPISGSRRRDKSSDDGDVAAMTSEAGESLICPEWLEVIELSKW
jgi:hypothetical protein